MTIDFKSNDKLGERLQTSRAMMDLTTMDIKNIKCTASDA